MEKLVRNLADALHIKVFHMANKHMKNYSISLSREKEMKA